MPQVTLRKRKPEHQNRVSKLIPRTGENHHTDPKKKPIKGKPYSHAEKAGRGKKKNGQTKTKPHELRHKTIGSANLKRI